MSVRPYHPKSAKPGEKWWVVDVGRGKTRRREPFMGTYEDAVELEDDLKTVLNGAKPEAIKSIANIRIKDLVVPFLQWYRQNYAEKTVRDMAYSFDLYIIPRFGDKHPSQLTVQMFHDMMSDLLNKGLRHGSINKHINYFASLTKWAVNAGKCRPLSFTIPRFPKKKTAPVEPIEPLTRREVDAIYKHIQPQYRVPFLLMLDHGLRMSEALELRIEHIDYARKIIRVVGKGNKTRIVPFMSDRFEKELEKATDGRFSGYLTVSTYRPSSGEERPYRTMWKELKRAANTAGVKRKINHHTLRHTFATLAAEADINPHALQQILGHASIETTNKIYTKVRQDFIGNEARELRKRMGK